MSHNRHNAHLRDSREEIQKHLAKHPTHQHHAAAAAHGWNLYDLTCTAPTRANHAAPLKPCGYPLKALPVKGDIAAEIRVKPCPKCAAKGHWSAVPSPVVEPPKKAASSKNA